MRLPLIFLISKLPIEIIIHQFWPISVPISSDQFQELKPQGLELVQPYSEVIDQWTNIRNRTKRKRRKTTKPIDGWINGWKEIQRINRVWKHLLTEKWHHLKFHENQDIWQCKDDDNCPRHDIRQDESWLVINIEHKRLKLAFFFSEKIRIGWFVFEKRGDSLLLLIP